MWNIETVLNNPIVDQIIVDKAKQEFETIKRDFAFLSCLRDAGVDNWSGYDYANQLFYDFFPEYRNDE